MKIFKGTKKQILADKDRLSIHQIAKKYSISRSEVENIFSTSTKSTRKWFYAIMVSLPIIFLVMLEIFLRIINYGTDFTQWVDAGEGKYIINPNIGKKYFTSRLITNAGFFPTTIEDVFDQEKKENTFRVFILGESSTEGYPYRPMGSFSRYIRKRMELVYPNTPIEVVNIGMTAINSYTLLDLVPGVLDQKPDLILIYTGHNEYYGAFGVGSVESAGPSRSLIKLVLYLNKFKITQFVRNSINWTLSLFTSENKVFSGTLMSQMAKDQSVLLNSSVYNAGLAQFKNNMVDILQMIKDKGVPVIMGKLVCNLRDQKPFISTNTPGQKTADQVFEEATVEFKNSNYRKADSLFRIAKDLDALRFRAPEKINDIIESLGKEFGVTTVPIDSVFSSASSGGIVGDNLIVDHLHPNIKGHQLIGKAFYESMEKHKFLPKTENAKIVFNKQDSITCANFVFSNLDSTIGNYNMVILKNNWPYAKQNKMMSSFQEEDFFKLLKPKNFTDTIAVYRTEGKISWSDAHLSAAANYLKKDDVKNYLKHMNILLYQYPNLRDYNSEVKFFYKNRKIDLSDYTPKRVGLIALFQGNYAGAIQSLTEAYKISPKNPSILYNLTLAYIGKKDLKNALSIIEYCLTIKPIYPEANKLRNQILLELKKQ